MNNELQTVSMLDLLPPNLANDETLRNAALSLDKELQAISKEIENVILLARLDELSSEAVDALAWQLHVDYYDATLPIETRRDLVRESIAWHRIKGTPAAVQAVVDAVVGGAEIQEAWQYGAPPYHFKITGITGPMPTASDMAKLEAMVISAKNVRSHCDGVEFIRNSDKRITKYLAPCVTECISVGMAEFKAPTIDTHKTWYGAVFVSQEVIV